MRKLSAFLALIWVSTLCSPHDVRAADASSEGKDKRANCRPFAFSASSVCSQSSASTRGSAASPSQLDAAPEALHGPLPCRGVKSHSDKPPQRSRNSFASRFSIGRSLVAPFTRFISSTRDGPQTASSSPSSSGYSSTRPADSPFSNPECHERQSFDCSSTGDVGFPFRRHISLFSQCCQEETDTNSRGGSSGTCHPNRRVAAPPSRHPLVSVESKHATDVPFKPEISPWHVAVSHARQAGLKGKVPNGTTHVHLWTLEILHKLLWIQSESLHRAISGLEPSEHSLKNILFCLLDVAEALMYAEGVWDLDLEAWYIELEEAMTFARATLDDALQILEQLFFPDFQDREQWLDVTAQSMTAHAGSVARRGGTSVKTKVGRGPTPHFRAFVQSTSQAAVAVVERARIAAAAEARAPEGFKYLLDGAQRRILHGDSLRLLEILKIRQQPVPLQTSQSWSDDPVRVFRVDVKESKHSRIPRKSKDIPLRRLIASLAELLESTTVVNLQNGANPRSLQEFLVLLTSLSKSLRRVLLMKMNIPALWKQEVEELLGYGYLRLEYLLSQRKSFLKKVPYLVKDEVQEGEEEGRVL